MLTDLVCSGFASLVQNRCLFFGIMSDSTLAPYSTGSRGMAESISISFDGTFRVRQHCFLMDTSIGWHSKL